MNILDSSNQHFKKIEGNTSGAIELTCINVDDILQGFTPLSQVIEDHILNWFYNPDPGSPFDKKTRILRPWIEKSAVIPFMQFLGYGGIIALWGDNIVGHAFFQKHGWIAPELHLFSIAVSEELRRRGIGTTIGKCFIEQARTQGIERARMGGGGDSDVKAIFIKIDGIKKSLGITTDKDFFIDFTDRKPRSTNMLVSEKTR